MNKKIPLVLTLLFFITAQFNNANAQITSTSNWTFMKGDDRTPRFPVYGTQSIEDAKNTIGGREAAAVWKDAAGNIWVYGGNGLGFDAYSRMNDLWKYNISSNNWTWIKGSQSGNKRPVWGTIGVPSINNSPGSRIFASTWVDASGNLWLFGGDIYGANSLDNGVINDLWKYDITTNMWTWVKGDTITRKPGVYGVQGVPNATNKPGARESASTWTDAAGFFWIYGGATSENNGGTGGFSDLWRYNPSTNEWTWMKGDNTPNQPGNYGIQGVTNATNNPGLRNQAMSAIDANGIFWLFGGRQGDNNGPFYMNDVWKYDPVTNNWTWMKGSSVTNPGAVYGVLGVPAPTNTPAGRSAGIFWADTSGNLLLFGGKVGLLMNDLWKYNIATNQWAWIKGSQVGDQLGIYGTQGVLAAANTPGGKYRGIGVTDAGGNLYLLGGRTKVTGTDYLFNDVWRYNSLTNQWVWLKGDDKSTREPTYGAQGVANAANSPGDRILMVTWNDPSGNLWAFGGSGIENQAAGAVFNTVWKYDISSNQWTWVKGSNSANKYSVYGTKGVAAPANTPGSRTQSVSWTDAMGNVWVFGGDAYLGSPNQGLTNELWKYDITTNQWTWMNGSNVPDTYGTYGTMGVPAAANTPGARYGSCTWIDNAGDLWLYGGFGYASSAFPNGTGSCGDLWKYSVATNQWAWMKGTNTIPFGSSYGTKGIEAATNTPGGRNGSACWTDLSGNLWLFGGNGDSPNGSGALNNVWRYKISTGNWTWINGDNAPNILGVYGAQGVPAATNKPGSHNSMMAFTYPDGSFGFFGGWGVPNVENFKGDIWKYDINSNLWTWLKGDTASNQYGVYGVQGVTASTNKPGTRYKGSSWCDNNGNLWIYSGSGSSSDTWGPLQPPNNYFGFEAPHYSLNDMWILGVVAPGPTVVKFCKNSGTTLSSNLTGTTYQWQQNTGSGYSNISDNVNFSGTNTASLQLMNIPASWNNYLYKCIVNGVQSSTVFKLSITTVSGTANVVATSCAGINDGKITVTTTSGGAPFVFSLDGGSFQSSNIFNGVAAGSHVIVIKDTLPCTDTLTVTVASGPSVVTPAVSIMAAPSNVICSGTSVTFTATPVNGGTAPIYHWLVNGIITGSNSNTFTSNSLNNNDQVSVSLKSSIPCHLPDTVLSNIIIMSVSPGVTAHAGNDTAICAGSSVQLLGSGGSVYQWTPAAGLNNPNIANPIATPLANTAYILRVSNGGTCVAYDTILISLVPSATPTVSINTASNNVCTGTAVSFTATSTNEGATPAYQWQVNGVNAGTNSNTFTTSTLTNNAQVKVIVTSSLACASPATATSNIITMTVTATPTANAGNDVNICTGGSTQLQASGGTTYSWSPVAGLSNPNIANPVASPAATTIYTVTVSNGINCTASDDVVVSVGPPATPAVSISTTSTAICQGSAATFTAVATNGGSNPFFQWQVNGINTGTNNNTFISSTLNNNDQVKAILTSSSACVTSTTATSNTITMNVDQLATPLISLSNRLYTVTNPDAAATYTWQQKINNIWGNVVPAATGTTYTATSGGEYRVKAIKGACTAFSLSQTTARNLNTFMHPFGIYLYPNPNTGILNIDSIRINQRWETLDITDVTGRVVLTFNIKNQSSVSLNVSMLKPGTYFAQLKKIDGVYYTVEFVKL